MVFSIILGSIIVITLLLWFIGYYVLLKFVTRMENRWQRIVHLLDRIERTTSDFLVGLDAHGQLPPGTTESFEKFMEEMQDPANERGEQLYAFALLHERLEPFFSIVDEELADEDKNLAELTAELKATIILVTTAWQAYDHAVQRYNKSIQRIPTNFVANVHQFKAQSISDASIKNLSTGNQTTYN